MSNAKSALGMTLKRDGHLIAELDDIPGVEMSLEDIDVTNHDSTNGYKEFIGGLRDGGEVAISGNFIAGDTDGQIGLMADHIAGTVQTFILAFSAAIGAQWEFTAVVKKCSALGGKANDKAKFKATLKVSGQPVLTIGASNNLSGLTASAGVFIPAFAAGTYTYVLTELTAVTGITLTPTASAGVIKVQNVAVTSGEASGTITLGAAGSLTAVVVTVTETGKIAKTYNISVARA